MTYSTTFPDMVASSFLKLIEEDKRVELWKAFDRRLIPRERRFASKMRELFAEQEAEVLKKLDRRKTMKQDDPLAPLLFQPEEWAIRFQTEATPLETNALAAAGQRVLDEVTAGIEFNVSDPRIVQYINDKTYKFSFQVNETTLKALRRQLSIGIERGEGIELLKNRVKEVFGIQKNSGARRIARTEIVGASNKGSFEGMVQSGVIEKKEWLATKDSRVRDTHAALDGNIVGLRESFRNGLEYPGDYSGPPEEIINCRCTVLPVVE